VLDISPSAVGKAVTRLEQELGVRLLQRSTRKLSLTDEGRQFHERCRRILDDLDDAKTTIAHAKGAPRGRLRISVPIVAYHLLLPLLPEFLDRHPEVELDIDFNDRIVDLIEEGVDLSIRSGDLSDSRFVSLPLRHYRLMLCASPGYLARRGEPRTVEDLATHDGIRFRFPNSGRLQAWPLVPSGETAIADIADIADIAATALSEAAPEPRLRRSLVFNNMEAVRGAALGGLGIACLPDFLALEILREGRLRRVVALHDKPAGRFRAVWPTSRHLSPKVRAFVDFLKERLRDE
jgi:DNA-binding transcriptional LysR family regulator